MTEREARQKWCPFTRAYWNGAAINRVVPGSQHEGQVVIETLCIANQCMAWRQAGPNDYYCGLMGKDDR
jgi:hypothetical protein